MDDIIIGSTGNTEEPLSWQVDANPKLGNSHDGPGFARVFGADKLLRGVCAGICGSGSPTDGKFEAKQAGWATGSTLVIKWSEEDKQVFEAVKAKLAESVILFHADPDKPFPLRCDACDEAFGAEVAQMVQGKWDPVAFYSRKFTGSEQN